MSWQESVDRVLRLRRVAELEADKAELVRILQEVEERFRVVVNRQAHEVLKGVPSWKNPKAESAGDQKRRMVHMGGMRTWADTRRGREKKLRVNTDRMQRRVAEVEQVLGQTQAGVPAPQIQDSEPRPGTVAVETEGDSNGA